MNVSKQKGTRFETQVCAFFSDWFGHAVKRNPLTGSADQGDITIGDWTIECKNAQKITLAEWMNETEAERKNAKTRFGVLVISRRMKGVAQSYSVMPLSQLAEIMSLLEDQCEAQDAV